METKVLSSICTATPSFFPNKPIIKQPQKLSLGLTHTLKPIKAASEQTNSSVTGDAIPEGNKNDNNNNNTTNRKMDALNIRYRSMSKKQARMQKQKEEQQQVGSEPKPPLKKWEEMTLGEKVVELYVGEKGLLFWLNKFAYASIFIIIGGWILFRFVGPSLNLYQLDAPVLSPSSVLKGSS